MIRALFNATPALAILVPTIAFGVPVGWALSVADGSLMRDRPRNPQT